MSNAATADILPGLKAVASRIVAAEENFIATLIDIGGIDRVAAERVLAYYRKNKLVKLDSVGGRMTVKHGALLDADIIRKAAAI